MDSTTSYGRAKCKHNVKGKVCTCQEWVPSEANESLCECCEHHMSFHEPLHPIASRSGRCVREFEDAEFSHEDGCQEFFPSCASSSRKCAGCGCHRSHHEPVTAVVGELAVPSNVHFQQQDSLSGDPSTSLLQSSSKRIRLDPTIVPTEADAEHERAAGFGHAVENGRDMAGVEPKHKVFLSHSGAQKEFVEQLCVDLERWDYYPFFDKRRSSLPAGMEFPPLLFAAIRQCEVGVVVLSEEFFWKTKWPMLELVKMVRVRKRSRPSMHILPVFLGISRQVCRNLRKDEKLMKIWEEWAQKDERINLDKWKSALDIFGSTTGLSLKKDHGEVSLRKEIVDAVFELVVPESRFDDSNVEGKDRLYKVISDKVGLEVEVKDPKVRVVGLYGVGGIGKTTICKVLCNKLFQQFRGRVWHTELKSASEEKLLQEALKILTDTMPDVLEGMNIDMCKDQLTRRIVKQPIFLAIDNVDENSAEQAKTYLGVKDRFGTGSVVVVTSRSLGQLEALNIHEDDCLGMPELELCEARELFRNTAKPIGAVECKLDGDIISRCVKMCLFKKDEESSHYHPLALTVLGNEVREQMATDKFNPSLWYSTFSKFEESFKSVEFKERIFSILRISYDTLSSDDKMLLMDVALFMRNWGSWDSSSYDFVGPDLYERLGMVHDVRKHDELKTRLEGLQKKSLLEKVGDGSTDVVMHDLWREFCVAETEAGEFAERRWVYFVESCRGLGESNQSGPRWEKLERMYFVSEAGVQKFLGLCLDRFSKVKVLRVAKCLVAREPRVVDFGKMIHLKYLEIKHPLNVFREPVTEEVEVRGLQSPNELAYLEWVCMPEEDRYAEDIGCLTNLQCLKLPYYRGKRLPDMSKLTSLRMAVFEYAEVKTITDPTGKLSNLQYLNLTHCRDLESCPGVGDLVGLKSLDISGCGLLEGLPNLSKLTSLTELKMEGCVSLSVCPDLSDLVSLEKLYASGCCKLAGFPDMRNLKKLQVLDILRCRVKRLPGFDSLIALRELKASFQLLEDWPVLDNFTSLRHVEIEGWNGPGLMSIAKLAMLESLTVGKYSKVRNLQLNLRNMERLQTFQVFQVKRILKNLSLEFSDGESKGACATNACQLKVVHVWDCQTLEEVEVINIPGLQSLLVSNCTIKRLTITESSGALRLMNGNGLRDSERVSNLSDFPGLRELCVIQCPHLTSFTTAKPLSALKNLELSGCESLTALLDLSYFPHLRSLDLHDCKRLTSLTSREPLLSLSELELTGCTGLAKLPDLSNFLNLRKLNLRRCESLTEITSKRPLPALKKVNLRRCRKIQDLPDLANFPQLKILDLHLCESLARISCSVTSLPLEKLCPRECESLESLRDLSYFPGLDTLRLIDWKSFIRISSEKRLRGLKILKLWRCQRLDALPNLHDFRDLKSLCLRDCKSLTTVESSKPLHALQGLDLGGCIRLKHLPDLRKFLSLRQLDLERCEGLVSLTSSGPLPALCYLNVKRCRSLKELPDHLCSSVKLRYLGVGASGIKLSQDTVNKLLASCVELESVDTFDCNWDLPGDRELHGWDEMVGDESDCDFEYDGLDEDFEDEGLEGGGGGF